jgi:hypothetical protein
MSIRTRLSSVALLWLVGTLVAGCGDTLEKQVAKSPNSIMGKKTQDIGEFDPAAGKQVSDSKVRIDTNDITAPVTGPLMAYGPALEQISKSHIEHALNLYNASEGRYPATHEEFMTHIIKANNIQLPVLPFGHKYEYDVPNHKLVVVIPPEAPAGEGAAAAPPAG